MVGKFVFGMLSGGVLVAGGLVIGSALFPLEPPAPEAEVASAPQPTEAATETAPAELQVAAPAVEPVEEPISTTEVEADPMAEPAQEAVAEAAPEITPEAEAPAPEPGAPTLPAADSEVEAVSENAPVLVPATDPAPAAAPEVAEVAAPLPDLAPLPDATPVPETAALPEASEPTPASDTAEAQPTAAEEPAGVAVPLMPLALPQLEIGAVLAALDRSTLAAEPAAPEVLAEAEPETEPGIVPGPEDDTAEAPEVAEVEPEAQAEPEMTESAIEIEPVPEPVIPPVAEGMPAPALDDGVTARLPGTAAPAMPGVRATTLPDAEGTAPEPELAELPDTRAEPAPALRPATGLGQGAGGVVTGRLPRIGDAPAEAAPEVAATADPADERPIARFAATFENPDAKPVLAIVLIDPGTTDLDRSGLAALPFPVSFALDPLNPATPDHAAIYRAAGKEVVMLATGIADGAQASDIEVAFQSMAQGLPEAVAVMDLPDVRFQNRRPLASLVVPVVGAQGRGLLTWDQGLNAADQVARREDIAAAVVFRDLVSAGEDGGSIRRILDRAVFKAGQDGRVALASMATPATVATLLEWAVEGRAATITLAPLTAVLTVD